jgi:hypothetical protein
MKTLYLPIVKKDDIVMVNARVSDHMLVRRPHPAYLYVMYVMYARSKK